ELPPEDRRRAEEVEAVTYSSESGLAQDFEERRPRRRPRRKRRPRPEVIANLRTGAENEEGEEEGVRSRRTLGAWKALQRCSPAACGAFLRLRAGVDGRAIAFE